MAARGRRRSVDFTFAQQVKKIDSFVPQEPFAVQTDFGKTVFSSKSDLVGDNPVSSRESDLESEIDDRFQSRSISDGQLDHSQVAHQNVPVETGSPRSTSTSPRKIIKSLLGKTSPRGGSPRTEHSSNTVSSTTSSTCSPRDPGTTGSPRSGNSSPRRFLPTSVKVLRPFRSSHSGTSSPRSPGRMSETINDPGSTGLEGFTTSEASLLFAPREEGWTYSPHHYDLFDASTTNDIERVQNLLPKVFGDDIRWILEHQSVISPISNEIIELLQSNLALRPQR